MLYFSKIHKIINRNRPKMKKMYICSPEKKRYSDSQQKKKEKTGGPDQQIIYYVPVAYGI